MKKTIYFLLVMLFTLSATMVSANNAKSDKSAVPVKTENKLSDKEIERIKNRVKEIRKMDKSELTRAEKNELKSELKEMKKEAKKGGDTIYIGGATLILIIILIILLV
ncbi:MAG: DUF6272 family protein [Bacteroidota bacterium]|nr:DUF6272 family protein [Bacteroidota bacterium]